MESQQKYSNFELESQKEEPYYQNTDGMFANTRLGFVQKVYGLLTCQLLFTVLMCIISMTSKSFLNFQVEYYGLFIFFMVLNMVIMITLFCFPHTSKVVPYNYILLGLFTFSESWIVSAMCGMTSPKIVFMAAVMTLGITVALTLYAITTKTDFTVYGGLMYLLGMGLLLFGIFAFFTDNKIINIIICLISVVILGIYLIYDTQLIIGNRKHSLEIDDYIIGALMLYVDIITLFMELIELLRNLTGEHN
jgi:hypothetical protein